MAGDDMAKDMAKLWSRFRLFAAVMAILVVTAVAPTAAADEYKPVNPTADAVKQQELLQQSDRIQGLGTIPDIKSYVLEQPMGRVWRQFHEVWLRWIGAIAVVGMLLLLTVFYLIRGKIRIAAGRSG
ncbi:MAG TPA: formate dehydrogenase subunit gamma, partial [Xanthobacteraceae bacterium]